MKEIITQTFYLLLQTDCLWKLNNNSRIMKRKFLMTFMQPMLSILWAAKLETLFFQITCQPIFVPIPMTPSQIPSYYN